MTAVAWTPPEVAVYWRSAYPTLRQRGLQWRGACPLHRGRRDSFAVSPESGAWHCHSKCARGGSLIDFEMRQTGRSFPEALKAAQQIVGRCASKAANGPAVVVARYVYCEENGAPLFRVCRTDPKGFYQQRWTGGRWVNGLRDTRRVLYHLSEVIEAPIVFLVEGEKDVETLRESGFVATTAAGGTGAKWLPEYTDTLRGREVILVPDGDEPGWRRAIELSRELVGKVARLVVFNDLPEGTKDISDWFAAGHSETELISILEGVHAG